MPGYVKQEVSYRSRRKEEVEGGIPRRIIPCEACDANVGPVLEYHHIIPVEHGGQHSARNLLKLCPTCHAFVTRDHCRWALWPRHELYSSEVAGRLSLLADIQHAPPGPFGSGGKKEAWNWLEALTGFTRDYLPENASWGNRWKREAGV